MEISLKHTHPGKEKSGAVVVAALGKTLSAEALQLDELSVGQLARALKQAGFDGKAGQTLTLHALPGIGADAVVVVGAGEEKDLDARQFQKVATAALKALQGLELGHATLFLESLPVQGRDSHGQLSELARLAVETNYRFDRFKSKKNGPKGVQKLHIACADKNGVTAGKAALAWGQAIGRGLNATRDLGNLPPNVCTPSYLADQAKALAKEQPKLSVKVLDEAELRKLGAGAFVAVAQGSAQDGKLIVMEYTGGKKSQKPQVLVGKGITFDTGGISIKPAAGMDEMKFDMCGAATVLGVMTALVDSQLPINVVGVIAAAENMPSGQASRPGDIVTTLAGKTVEILNTDAEGRLVLCDAMTYALRYKPEALIDIATLTGACVVALGKVATGLFSNNDALADTLLAAGQTSGDRAWRMPVWSDYQELLDSPFADMANIGGPTAGSITAACFLSRFVEDVPWAHLDIAGTAWNTGSNKGATGRPVPLLMQYLAQAAGQA